MMKSLCKGTFVPSVSWQWSCRSVDSGYLPKQEFSADIKDADIPRKNLVKQGNLVVKLVTNGQAFNISVQQTTSYLFSPFLCKKGLAHPDPFRG